MTKRIVQILMERDGLSKDEAIALLKDVRAELYECIDKGDYSSAEDIMLDELGLEMDYIFDLIYW